MAIKQVLLPLVSYPRATEVAAIAKAVAVAKRLGAGMTAIAFDLDVVIPGSLQTRPLNSDSPVVETPEHQKSHVNATQLIKAFEATADASAVRHSQIIGRCVSEDMPTQVAVYARTHDLALVPIVPLDDAYEKIVEALIFESGRPLLIFPAQSVGELPDAFGHVAIAWDNSRQSARAVADAMPLLKNARMVSIFTAADKNAAADIDSGATLVRHLDAHGIKATFEIVRKNGSATGKVFESFVQQNQIDLLVMGAYRHSRLQEFIMGGATYSMVGRPPCWVLMSH
ncbi:MAG TPA: universal stress protein [Tardiphaga sp.]